MLPRNWLIAGLLTFVNSIATADALAGSSSAEDCAQGTLVILGGAVRDDHDALWRAIVEAAGGPGSLILVLATASQTPQRTGDLAAKNLQRHGAQAEVLPIAPHWPGLDAAEARARAHDPRWVERVRQAQGIFMTGGFQERLMDSLRPGGHESPLLQAIRQLHLRGGVVAGTSAGAAVMSETAIRRLGDPFEALLRPLNTGEVGLGFGLIPAEVVIDQHFMRHGRIARLVRVLLQSGRALGLGVDEDSGAVVRGAVAQAIGKRGLLMVDASEAVVDSEAPLQVSQLRLSYVDRHDRFDLDTRRLVPAYTRQTLPPNMKTRKPVFFGDILGDNMLISALERAAEGPQRPALGLAWRLNGATAFEWRLSADDQTRAWGSPTSTDHSFERVRLDIRPVRLAQPVYDGAPSDVRGAAAQP